MSIRGVGTDIIEIDRISHNLTQYGKKFLNRIFTQEEQAYCERFHYSARSYAARFAAKEAVVKAIGTGFIEGITWLDIEIRNDPQGKPYVILSEDLNARFNSPKIDISLSHSRDFATAVAIWSE